MTDQAARELSEDELSEIKKRSVACPDMNPYVTDKGGVVIFNGPFPMNRARAAEASIKNYKSDIPALIVEVRRLRAALAAQRRQALAEAEQACRDEMVDAMATGDNSDAVYNSACKDCASAIEALRD